MTRNNPQQNQDLYEQLSISQALPSMSDDEIHAEKKRVLQRLAALYNKDNKDKSVSTGNQ